MSVGLSYMWSIFALYFSGSGGVKNLMTKKIDKTALKLVFKLLPAKNYCCMTSILWHIAETFPPARQGTILNNHQIFGIATNTSMVLNCALVTYLMMTVEVGLPDVV